MAKDYLGNEIEIGDKVVYVRLGYRDLTKGIIHHITPKMVKIKRDINSQTIVKQYHDQVIKIGEMPEPG